MCHWRANIGMAVDFVRDGGLRGMMDCNAYCLILSGLRLNVDGNAGMGTD